MNAGAGRCPSAVEIEKHAADPSADDGVREHVSGCDACRKRLEDAEFEREFASALNAKPGRGDFADGPRPELPGYEIVREVSRGGQGIVYEAIQTRTRRRVALKVLRQDHGLSRSQRARFDREIEIAAALAHPGIVGVYDSIAMPGGRHALVLEYVEGEALDRQNLVSGDEGRPRAAVELIAKVCDAIHYAHQRGVIHRDLKPSNILVDGVGQPRILDFGVACWFGASGADAARITLTGEFAGTLAYAAPEQVSGVVGAPDLRSDLYALGVMLYQLCFGSLPYEVNGPLDSVIRNILASAPTRTRIGRGSGVDEDLWVIINKALAKEPDRRYQSAAAMGADLRRYLNGETIEARRDSRMYVLRKTISRHRVAAGAILATFAGLAAFGVSVTLSNARLSEALRKSTFERARALGAAGSRPEADMLLWPDILRLGPALVDPQRAAFNGTPEERRVLWAFIEMQGAAPCLVSAATPPVRRTAFACTDDRMVSMTFDGELSEWSIPDLRPISNRRILQQKIVDMAVSIPGNVWVGFDRPDLVVMDLTTGVEIARKSLTQEMRIRLRISMDGSRVVASSDETGVHVFELPSLRLVFRKVGDMSSHAPWLSDSGDRVGIIQRDHEVAVYRVSDGTLDALWPLSNITESRIANRGSIFQNLVISERGNRMAVVTGHHVHVRQGAAGVESKLLSVTVGSIAMPSFSTSGEWMLTRGDADPLVKLWRTGDWTQRIVYAGHADQCTGALMTPDERFVVTVDLLGAFRVWPGPRTEAIWDLPESNMSPHDLAVDAARHTVWAAASDGRVGRWTLDRPASWEFVRADPAAAFSVAYSPQLEVLAATGKTGIVSLFDRESKPVRTLGVMGSGEMSCVRFSPGGKLLAACGRKGPIAIYDTSTWERAANIETESGRIVMARWSPDGKMLGIACASITGSVGTPGNCEIYEVASGRLFKRWAAHPIACRAIEFSPDGQVFATAGNDGMLQLWNTTTWEPTDVMYVNNSSLFCLAFHANGNVLAVGDRSGRVTMIGLPERKVLAHFDCGISIMALEFVGERLVVAPLDLPITVRDFGMIASCIPGNVEFWKSRLEKQGAEELKSRK